MSLTFTVVNVLQEIYNFMRCQDIPLPKSEHQPNGLVPVFTYGDWLIANTVCLEVVGDLLLTKRNNKYASSR